MGKKKSVVLMTILTIVIAVLCATIVVPSFTLPFLWNGAKSDWNPVVKTYDYGSDLGGGYYTYYYPEGVISETEYKFESEMKSGEELTEYQNSYIPYKGLYLSTDTKDGVVDEDKAIKDSFKKSFNEAVKQVTSRFEKKGYSSFRVSVVDDYVIRAELPKSETAVGETFSYFGQLGEFTITDGTKTLFESTKDVVPTDYFKSFEAKTNREASFVAVNLTNEGRKFIKDVTSDIVASSQNQQNQQNQQQAPSALTFKVGDEVVIQLSVSEVMNEKTLYIGGGKYDEQTAKAVAVLLDSAIHSEDAGIRLKADNVRTFDPIYSENTLMLFYIAMIVIILLAIILPIIKYRGFGGAMAYVTLSYFIITTICFAFITGGVFEITLGTVITFLMGLVLTTILNGYLYGIIKKEVETGKTIESSVKNGFKSTLWGVIDIYAVLIGAVLFFLIGAAGLHTMALQALICLISGAFCNLLWTRAINYMMISASKDKYKYFHLVREDDDDE